MKTSPIHKTPAIHSKILIITLLSLTLLLTGCSDMVEVQDRDFALALGIGLKDNQYEFTFALPDLSALTKEKNGDEEDEYGQIRTYQSISLSEMEDLYNHGSNKRLDYRHLQALILDESISSSADKLPALFEYLDNTYEISRNVHLFYYPGDVKELLETKGKIGGSIGDYLLKLENNNQRRNNLPSITTGNLLDSYYQNKDLIVPLLELKEGKLEVNGAAIFQDSVYARTMTDEELNIYYVIKGEGKEIKFHTENQLVFNLREYKSKTRYFYEDDKPIIELSITGTADLLSESQNDTNTKYEINDYFKEAVLHQINNYFKLEKLDYLNLYEKSSIKNRNIWLAYENRRESFINEVEIIITIDIKCEK